MRPATIHEAGQRIQQGEPWSTALGDFLQAFYTAPDVTARIAMLARAPDRTKDAQLDALMGGIAEYLYKRWTRVEPPRWMGEPERYLAELWFTTESRDPAVLEYLTFVSPPEFKSRNIMTEEAPLRRASLRAMP
ncbi:MAG TPA: hypothetical protein VH414_05545 [Lichenihabitans sp.]|jgi:hypothetical protein|nr:hypothetical protein [Lichenihabitans sp.]